MSLKSAVSGSSADASSSSQQTQERIPQQAAAKRRAMPPGFLGNYMQARASMASVGLGPAAPEGHGRASSSGPAGCSTRTSVLGPSAAGQRAAPFVPATTLPSLFAHRKHYLRAQRRANPDQQPYCQHQGKPVGFLSLPEDVLLKILCFLKHDELRPLMAVCTQLRKTFKDAVVFHFNFTTPYRPSNEESLPGQPRPPVRTRKRSATNLAVVLARLGRNNRHLAPGALNVCGPRSTAPRALTFPDAAPPGA
ncbi:hypothetical protein ACKKBG_A07720 [Auxenochlorella protothecoides x Auxenochlorella symbiontica]